MNKKTIPPVMLKEKKHEDWIDAECAKKSKFEYFLSGKSTIDEYAFLLGYYTDRELYSFSSIANLRLVVQNYTRLVQAVKDDLQKEKTLREKINNLPRKIAVNELSEFLEILKNIKDYVVCIDKKIKKGIS